MNELSEAQGAFLLYTVGKEEGTMKYLKIFTDFMEVVEPLEDDERGRLFAAMLGYALDGREPQLPGNERFVWTVAKQHINREVSAYMAKVKNLKRGNGPVSEKKDPVSEEDNDKNNDKYKNKDDDIYIGAEAPAPKAHIYIQPPTLDEIASYCEERGNNVDPQYFYNYYRSNGWKVGKNPMKDWKAAVCAWESNGMGDKRAPVKEPSVGDNFKIAMEMMRRKEAKEI